MALFLIFEMYRTAMTDLFPWCVLTIQCQCRHQFKIKLQTPDIRVTSVISVMVTQ